MKMNEPIGKTKFTHAKTQSDSFDDGTPALYSGNIQLLSLMAVMGGSDYDLVYTDSSVLFRHKQTKDVISFENACKYHNGHMTNLHIVNRVKLQRSRGEIKTLCNKVQFTRKANIQFLQTAFSGVRVTTTFDLWSKIANELLTQKG